MLTILADAEMILPDAVRERLKQWRFAQRLYERAVIIRQYRHRFGRRPNLRHPGTFSEKLAFKMLYDRRPLLTQIADKVRARDYVAQRIGSQFLSEIYQVCESVDQIRWEELPSSFAIKTNHGSKMNIMVYDKSTLNKERTRSQLNIWLGRNFYYHLREWCYRDIRPMIMFEELLHNVPGQRPVEWKFYVFDGCTKYVEVSCGPDGDRKKTFYDRSLKRLNARWAIFPTSPEDPVFPENLDAMISLAERLAHGLDFVRVDLYNVAGRIVFGELTSYPGAGLVAFEPPEFDRIFGQTWRPPHKYQ